MLGGTLGLGLKPEQTETEQAPDSISANLRKGPLLNCPEVLGAKKLFPPETSPMKVSRFLGPLKSLLKNWRVKAAVLKVFSLLPGALGTKLHYFTQSRLGALRKLEPWTRLEGALKASDLYCQFEGSLSDKRVLEVGTGWRINAPLAFALLGAETVVSVDLNYFLKPDLILRDLQILVEEEEKLRRLFVDRHFHEERWARVKMMVEGTLPLNIETLKEHLGITYLAPRDASAMDEFESSSFALHFSQNTFEHIPLDSLSSILREAWRLLGDSGLAVHGIDQSDHFSHFDSSISSANFLSYEQQQWDRFAGHRFAYVNRLRAPEYTRLFKELGFTVKAEEVEVDHQALELLSKRELQPCPQFQTFSMEQLATRYSWVVAGT
jgi:hypothetical protein